jgi:hypothetical protein
VTLIGEADATLDRRTELEAAAAAADLRLPSRLETLFESDAGFAAVNAEADAEAAAIEIIGGSAATRPATPDVLQQLGLYGATPDVQLATAREAFAAGELERSAREALSARATWESASEVGRNRLLAAIGIALIVLVGILLIMARWRDHRRRRRTGDEAAASAAPPSAGDPAAG